MSKKRLKMSKSTKYRLADSSSSNNNKKQKLPNTYSYVYPVVNLQNPKAPHMSQVTSFSSSSPPTSSSIPDNNNTTTTLLFQSSDYGEGRALHATPLSFLRSQMEASKKSRPLQHNHKAGEGDDEGEVPMELVMDTLSWEVYQLAANLMSVKREYHRIRISSYQITQKDNRRELLHTEEVNNDDWHRDDDVGYLNIDSHVLLREVSLMMPFILDERNWMRHRLSWSNVMLLLNACPKTDIWRKTLFDGLPLLNSASKTSWISATSMIFGGKRTAINKQELELKERWPSWVTRPSALLHIASLHKNPIFLPFRYVSAHMIHLSKQCVPQPHTTEMWLGQPVRVYPSCLRWASYATRHYVPLAVYENVHQHYDFVLLNRILPYDLYKSLRTEPTCIAEWPDIIRVQDTFWALEDEAFWLWSETTIVL